VRFSRKKSDLHLTPLVNPALGYFSMDFGLKLRRPGVPSSPIGPKWTHGMNPTHAGR